VDDSIISQPVTGDKANEKRGLSKSNALQAERFKCERCPNGRAGAKERQEIMKRTKKERRSGSACKVQANQRSIVDGLFNFSGKINGDCLKQLQKSVAEVWEFRKARNSDQKFSYNDAN